MLPTDIRRENGLGTLKFFIYSYILTSFYSIVRIHKMADIIEKATGRKVMPIGLYYILYWTYWFTIYSVMKMPGLDNKPDPYVAGVLMAAGLFWVLSIIILLCWSFRARTRIQSYSDEKLGFLYRMNGFYTFFFNIFYINYTLNNLQNAYLQHEYAKTSNT